METKIGGKINQFYGPVVSDLNLKAGGKKTMEWDLNDWNWDGDLFTAVPLNSVPSDCRSKQLFPIGSDVQEIATGVSNSLSSGSDEMGLGIDKVRKELEKRRRAVVSEDDELNDEAASLNLKLGGQLYPIMEREDGKSGKKSKVAGASSNRAVCQIEDCQADLSNAKDYHRRHKVCDVHSKAVSALVGNVMQRFCQQCSRFHILEEFDEGKRSCRRRLAGHNKRRRKTHPENVANGASMNDERGSNYLLISLLRILANIHSNNADQTKDQDLLSHLLRNLASLASAANGRNAAGLPSATPDLRNTGTTSEEICLKDSPQPNGQCMSIPTPEVREKRMGMGGTDCGIPQNRCASQPDSLYLRKESIPANANVPATSLAGMKLSNIDLNNSYDDSQDGIGKVHNPDATMNLGNGSTGYPLWLCQEPHKSSPTRISGNSGSTSTLSPSNSSGESRTDRIVFKLFGKDPSDFPTTLRKQILDWLAHSPTDIESYIRPGCIILTIYLRMDKSIWEELYCDLSSSLTKLLNASTDSFWRTGWVYTRVQHRVAFIFNGQVVLDTPLPVTSHRNCRISTIKPLAVSATEGVQFLVKGFNLSRPTTRLLCALEGKYLVQGSCTDMMGGVDSYIEHEEPQSLGFPCIMPNITGRGFIEVEDHGLCSSFFPFIVAEKDVCSEIRTLENIIEVTETADGFLGETEELQARDEALDFIHEMGWLLHRSQLQLRLGSGSNLNLFPFERFKWLIEFSVDHAWCAVVKNLLGIFFNGIVDVRQHSSLDIALQEVGVLHRAVRGNSRSVVEMLLRYSPSGVLDKSGVEKQQGRGSYLFRPDTEGPGGLTPLHIVASVDGYDGLLEALIDDPGQIGTEAWRSARDSTGLTPNDYASLRGHYSYIHIIQKKINQKSSSGHVVVNIPGTLLNSSFKQKLEDDHKSVKVGSLQTEKPLTKPIQRQCRLCERKFSYGNMGTTSVAIYKPAMLSMVAIAAICVCVALLFKSSPEVLYVFKPFRWEQLKYGSS
uniref:Squamosa promoter binding-like protein 12d n=1 Tax=Petunia hybrida TaxID=4102 RepID=A0A2K9ZXI9_PETHY|nr:squamosa promoter binding-like protein 12d [Petunia x hybrida]